VLGAVARGVLGMRGPFIMQPPKLPALAEADDPTVPLAEPPAEPLLVGRRVRLQGLESAAAARLNGRVGRVAGRARGRIVVRLFAEGSGGGEVDSAEPVVSLAAARLVALGAAPPRLGAEPHDPEGVARATRTARNLGLLDAPTTTIEVLREGDEGDEEGEGGSASGGGGSSRGGVTDGRAAGA